MARVMNDADLKAALNKLANYFYAPDDHAMKDDAAAEILDLCEVNAYYDKCGNLYYDAKRYLKRI